MCRNTIKKLFMIGALITFSWVNCVSAGVVIGSTRVIYRGEKDEVTVKLTNTNPSPVLVQIWLDKGDDKVSPEKLDVPFVLTPPINRMNPGKGQTIRISYIGTPALPMDKESVFWLNVLEVPAKKKSVADKNKVNVAFRTRIKLFYRPEGLAGNANEAPNLLRWSTSGDGVTASNPTLYHVSLGALYYTNNGKKYEVPGSMIAPGSSQSFKFKDLPSVTDINQLTYSAINDYGAFNTYKSNGK